MYPEWAAGNTEQVQLADLVFVLVFNYLREIVIDQFTQAYREQTLCWNTASIVH